MRYPLAIAGLLITVPAAAQVRAVPDQPATSAAAAGGVDVFLINEGTSAAPAEGPAEIEITTRDGVRLTLARPDGAVETLASGAFVRRRYRYSAVVIAEVPPARQPQASAAVYSPTETTVAGANGSASGFVDRFQPYEPIYGIFGSGTSGAKLQVSFAMQPFGGDGALSHFRFAYTQTMFWAIDRSSGPFRATTYSPEAFADVPLSRGLRLAAGYRHDSNGEGQRTSIDVNRLYVGVAKSFDLGGRWHAEVAPQAWVYVGKRGIGVDIPHYWGFTGLKASIAEDDGIKLAMSARGNPRTGRGAAEFFASYPLTRFGPDFGVYLFGQAFTGFGEALDDFRVRESHARLGIALTR